MVDRPPRCDCGGYPHDETCPRTLAKKAKKMTKKKDAPHVVIGHNSIRCINCGDELMLPLPLSVNVVVGMGEGFTKDHRECEPSEFGRKRFEFETPDEWFKSWDTGLSSKVIYHVMTDTYLPGKGSELPRDADDFGRCYRLLKKFAPWRATLSRVSDRFSEWAPIVKAWAELEELFEKKEFAKLHTRLTELGKHPQDVTNA